MHINKRMLLILMILGMGPATITTAAEINELLLLSVGKKSLQAELRTLPAPHEQSLLLQSFPIAIGKELGDKFKEGDNRTPEGIYFPTRHINTANVRPSKYGDISIAINFPNPIDQLQGKTGYGIWLHGAGNDKRIADKQVTEGCIAFYNDHMERLSHWLKPGAGVIVIAKEIQDINIPADIEALTQATHAWIEAWKTRDIDSYISSYSQDFVNRNMDKKAYHQYKKQVFGSYHSMTVTIDHLRIISQPKYAMAMMNQDFRGDKRFHSYGKKVVYWHKTQDGWKIVRENFDRQRLDPITFNDTDLLGLQEITSQKIRL